MTFRLKRLHPAKLGAEPIDIAIVIDVLRATSTATVLLSRGVDPVRVVATPADLAALAPARGGYLAVSELADAGPDRVDNSPALVRQLELEGKAPVLVTTNGSRALDAAGRRASKVLAASFLNLSAVVAAVQSSGSSRIALLPAGDFERGEPHFEDERCADALEMRLLSRECDPVALAASCRQDARVQRRVERGGASFAKDLDLCLTCDLYVVVPRFVPEGPGRGRLIRS